MVLANPTYATPDPKTTQHYRRGSDAGKNIHETDSLPGSAQNQALAKQ